MNIEYFQQTVHEHSIACNVCRKYLNTNTFVEILLYRYIAQTKGPSLNISWSSYNSVLMDTTPFSIKPAGGCWSSLISITSLQQDDLPGQKLFSGIHSTMVVIT